MQHLQSAIKKLQDEFEKLDFSPIDADSLVANSASSLALANSAVTNAIHTPTSPTRDLIYKWPGRNNEDIIICVHKSNGVQEKFHRHEFFYFNFTYKGSYESLSQKYDQKICIKENELYAGQPLAPHALCVHNNTETIIFGVLIKRETFIKFFLPMLCENSILFKFFIDPSTSRFSQEFIHIKLQNPAIKTILEMMITEYAFQKPDTQQILKPLALSFLMLLTREYSAQTKATKCEKLSDQIIQYMNTFSSNLSLTKLASHFGYHPNYICAVLKKETGKTFSSLLLEGRMQKAELLLKNNDITIEEIAEILGYSNTSNFYKAYKEYFGHTPRGEK